MIDYVHIKVKAGNGGSGHVSFKTARGKPFGEAEGGDGGKGGDVIIIPSKDLNTLAPYRYKKDFQASSGGNGGRNNRTGENAVDLFLEVPLGTMVKDKDGEQITDLTTYEDRVLVAEGGKGGRGNAHLKHLVTEKKKQGEKGLIRVFEPGFEGEEVDLILELKVLADVGLVGLPNAGKSTLLSKLTAATPKIADYPFTTLEPNLGVMHYKGKEMVIADIPGLIEGASVGKGLGVQFLRHVERTRLLLHLIALDSQDPLRDYNIVNSELSTHSEKLNKTPQIIVFNKTDLIDNERAKKIEEEFKKKKIKILKISALAEVGLEDLKKEIIKRFR